ncbi:uncharacterized protein LOC136031452 [Artemia franciscana]
MMDVLIEDLPNSDEDDNVYEILVRKNTKIQNRKRSINDTLLERSVNGFRNNLKKESEEFGELCFIKKEHQEIDFEMERDSRTTFLSAFSADGLTVATTHGDHSIRIFDVRSRRLIQTLRGHPRTPWTVKFHPVVNTLLVSGCLAGHVRVWDILNGESERYAVEEAPYVSSVITSACFHPTEQLVVFSSGNVIYLWDWYSNCILAKMETRSNRESIRYVEFDPTGTRLITAIWNPISQSRMSTAQSVESQRPTAAAENIEENSGQLRARYQDLLSRYASLRSRYRNLFHWATSVDNLESSGPTGNNDSQPSANIEGEAPESSRQPENPRQGRDNAEVRRYRSESSSTSSDEGPNQQRGRDTPGYGYWNPNIVSRRRAHGRSTRPRNPRASELDRNIQLQRQLESLRQSQRSIENSMRTVIYKTIRTRLLLFQVMCTRLEGQLTYARQMSEDSSSQDRNWDAPQRRQYEAVFSSAIRCRFTVTSIVTYLADLANQLEEENEASTRTASLNEMTSRRRHQDPELIPRRERPRTQGLLDQASTARRQSSIDSLTSPSEEASNASTPIDIQHENQLELNREFMFRRGREYSWPERHRRQAALDRAAARRRIQRYRDYQAFSLLPPPPPPSLPPFNNVLEPSEPQRGSFNNFSENTIQLHDLPDIRRSLRELTESHDYMSYDQTRLLQESRRRFRESVNEARRSYRRARRDEDRRHHNRIEPNDTGDNREAFRPDEETVNRDGASTEEHQETQSESPLPLAVRQMIERGISRVLRSFEECISAVFLLDEVHRLNSSISLDNIFDMIDTLQTLVLDFVECNGISSNTLPEESRLQPHLRGLQNLGLRALRIFVDTTRRTLVQDIPDSTSTNNNSMAGSAVSFRQEFHNLFEQVQEFVVSVGQRRGVDLTSHVARSTTHAPHSTTGPAVADQMQINGSGRNINVEPMGNTSPRVFNENTARRNEILRGDRTSNFADRIQSLLERLTAVNERIDQNLIGDPRGNRRTDTGTRRRENYLDNPRFVDNRNNLRERNNISDLATQYYNSIDAISRLRNRIRDYLDNRTENTVTRSELANETRADLAAYFSERFRAQRQRFINIFRNQNEPAETETTQNSTEVTGTRVDNEQPLQITNEDSLLREVDAARDRPVVPRSGTDYGTFPEMLRSEEVPVIELEPVQLLPQDLSENNRGSSNSSPDIDSINRTITITHLARQPRERYIPYVPRRRTDNGIFSEILRSEETSVLEVESVQHIPQDLSENTHGSSSGSIGIVSAGRSIPNSYEARLPRERYRPYVPRRRTDNGIFSEILRNEETSVLEVEPLEISLEDVSENPLSNNVSSSEIFSAGSSAIFGNQAPQLRESTASRNQSDTAQTEVTRNPTDILTRTIDNARPQQIEPSEESVARENYLAQRFRERYGSPHSSILPRERVFAGVSVASSDPGISSVSATDNALVSEVPAAEESLIYGNGLFGNRLPNPSPLLNHLQRNENETTRRRELRINLPPRPLVRQNAMSNVLLDDFVLPGNSQFFICQLTPQTFRIQCWDFKNSLPDLTQSKHNVIVPNCKVHCDSWIEISKKWDFLVAVYPKTTGLFGASIGVHSLESHNLGQLLWITSIGESVASLSLSPSSRYLLVGIPGSRLWNTESNSRQTMAKVFRLDPDAKVEEKDGKSEIRSLELVRTIVRDPENSGGQWTLNSIQWSPHASTGWIVCTNRGHVKVIS